VITDPPYGIGFSYGEKEVINKPEKYWHWYKTFHQEYLRILKPGGLWAIWQSGTYHKYLWEWFGEDIYIFIAAKNFVQLRNTPVNRAYDPIVMNYKNNNKPLRPTKPDRNLDYFVSNMAGLISNPNRPERQHPTPKPLDVVKTITHNFSLPSGIVLDPFMGSGTTGVACVQTGRNFIGIEIDPNYYAIAEKRIAEAQLQTRLPI
jgi:site-specific DNA-methyltransferase (adenine-specific)